MQPQKPVEPAKAGDSPRSIRRCRPFHGLTSLIISVILGLAPQALCCHLLRRFKNSDAAYTGLGQRLAGSFPGGIQDVHLAEACGRAAVAHRVRLSRLALPVAEGAAELVGRLAAEPVT